MSETYVPLPDDDFRRERMMLSPSAFFWPDGEPESYAPPTDMIDREAWNHVIDLSTHVALATSSHDGSAITRLNQLSSEWIFSWPEAGTAVFMDYPALIAGEEFEALTFNTLHGFYRQAISCLRVGLETLTIAAGFAVENDVASFDAWQRGDQEGKFGRGRIKLRDSTEGRRIETAAQPHSVFGDADDAWLNARFKRLCDYVHSRAGHDNGGFWESNGPLWVPRALETVEDELRETLALCYLLERLGWSGYETGPGQPALLNGPTTGWTQYLPVLRAELL